jgi:hypothetical protein
MAEISPFYPHLPYLVAGTVFEDSTRRTACEIFGIISELFAFAMKNSRETRGTGEIFGEHSGITQFCKIIANANRRNICDLGFLSFQVGPLCLLCADS